MPLNQFCFAAFVTICVAPISQAQVDGDFDDELPYKAGLVFTRAKGDAILAKTAFTPEIRTSPLEWHGYLENDSVGEYRIGARFTGDLKIWLNDRLVIESSAIESKWVFSEPIDLKYAYHPIRIELRTANNVASSLTTYWSGPGFRFEPIPARALWHSRSDAEPQSLTRGAHLARFLRCQACHSIGDMPPAAPLRSPSLETAAANLREEWLLSFFSSAQSGSKSTRPFDALHATFTVSEARDLVAWLRSEKSGAIPKHGKDLRGSQEEGERLFLTVGCLACHTHDGTGSHSLFGGGDLTGIAAKRPAGFLARWLRNPSSVNPHHRMPEFDLTDAEVANLAHFLAGDDLASDAEAKSTAARGNAARGALLVKENHCLRCHAHGVRQSPPQLPALTSESNWEQGCLATDAGGRPRYRLETDEDRLAIKAFIQNPPHFDPSGALLLAENNCLHCHARGTHPGIAAANESLLERDSTLIPGSVAPPSLNSIGDKLHDRVLRDSISRKEPSHRKWLAVQMPKFPLSAQAIDQIAGHLIAEDRVPDAAYPAQMGNDDEGVAVADRMLTSEGFGCVSCHQVGKMEPPENTPLNQLGPSLSMPKDRIRKIWFDRWVRNPARITPKMEMPSVQIPIPIVLGGNLDRQLNAVWNILNIPKFTPPDPAPVRTVHRSGDMSEPAVALTDVLRLNGRKLIKPFLIGLPNRNNVLLDLDHARLAAWWTGDTAVQRTQGKTWFWDSPMIEVPETAVTPEFVLLDNGNTVLPERIGQFMTEADQWTQEQAGLTLEHRLRFANVGSDIPNTIRITQRFIAAPKGWRRHISFSELESGSVIGIRSEFEDSDSVAGYTQRDGLILVPVDDNGLAEITLAYSSDAIATNVSVRKDTAATSPLKELDVMPGFRLTQLPLRDDVMPIALAWTPTGELLIGSLKGRVWRGTDEDDDGLEDALQPISDELAAPYGIAATEDHIDVLCKYGIVRLHDRNGDGVADRHEVVASGWGHTDDYHDWVVGLPIDESGSYYVAIPCQQDDRSLPAAVYRGTVLRLSPRVPSSAAPRHFTLEQISAGHRFPMGIARNRAGQLFVTDNQGNYNPFNELNHVLPGARYGFLNKVERIDGFEPPLTPPAIDIPHPWTRSVNGICFLETPSHLAEEEKIFGPFEGHLLGCEYDTRRLIRMSLEEVDGWIQGAAYPMAEAHERASDGFQGPVQCALSPSGEVYVASIRDSGWGGGNNKGSIVRVVPDLANLPAGIAEVNVESGGFRIRFTRPINKTLAADVNTYTISSYRRKSTPAYGGDDIERRQERITQANVADDELSVELKLNDLRAGFVYEFRLKNLAKPEQLFYPAEAHYTLRKLRD